MNVMKATMMGLIEADLQQGWECLDADQFDLAKTHFTEAARKVEEMETVISAEARKQLVLDV